MLRMGSFRIGEDLCHTPPRLKRGLSKLDDETVGRSVVGSGLLLDYTQSSQVVLETMEGLSQTPFGSGAKSSPSLLCSYPRLLDVVLQPPVCYLNHLLGHHFPCFNQPVFGTSHLL